MKFGNSFTLYPSNMSDNSGNEARFNVLYSPFRKREVNPQDWESKMCFWKNNIMNWCLDKNSCVFTLAKLQSSFIRNGRPASCLDTVLNDLLRNNEIIRLQDLLSKDADNQSWSMWAVNCLVKAPIVWSFTKLKESLVANLESNTDEEYVHIGVLKKYSDSLRENCLIKASNQVVSLEDIKARMNVEDSLSVKVVLHWLQLQGYAAVTTINNKVIVKVSPNDKIKPFTEADLGLYRLQQNEQALVQMLEQLEKEKQDTEQEARNYIKKGMRQVAKSCLRKKRELEKCIYKRASALENVQVLLSRVKEAESDGEILEAYKLGLSTLKATFKDAGLSEDSVSYTMDHVQEVLEVHEEIQDALSKPLATSADEDLESELAMLLSAAEELETDTQPRAANKSKTQEQLPDLPEPPSHSLISTTPDATTGKIAQDLLS